MTTDNPPSQQSPQPPPSQQEAQPQNLRFQFDGNGREFFRIWIVNILLSIVTLGIYSAWAKVRTNRYLYGNTHVAGGHFDYHADPLIILRGRIIAIVFLLAYTFAAELFPLVGAALFLALVIALPFIVVRALTFNARMSSWRNIRFNFVGGVGGAFGAYFAWPMLGVFSLGLAMPYAWFKKAEFGVDNHRLGGTPFTLSARPRDFYIIALILGVLATAMMVVFAMLAEGLGTALGLGEGMAEGVSDSAGQSDEGADDNEMAAIVGALFVPIIFLGYFAAYSLYSAMRFQAIYTHLGLGENRINTSIHIGRYIMIAVTNGLLMAVTLGLYYPWAKVRMTNYLVESLELHAVNVDGFVAQAAEDESAFGEEFGEAFDLGIGV